MPWSGIEGTEEVRRNLDLECTAIRAHLRSEDVYKTEI